MSRKNTYAVITGASSGIGAEFARQLAKEGYRLILAARRADRMERLAEELDTECMIVEADLSKVKECRKLMNAVEKKKVSVFINNAGFGECGRFLETDLEKELNMIDVNVKAMHYLTKLVLKKMEQQKGGYLLNVASSAGLMPAGPYMAAYYATKAYVASMTRAIAEELRESGSPVYIGCLCPGPVRTEFDHVANVEFALNGITAEYCVDYAIRQMKKHKTVIIPTLVMKMAVTSARLAPQQICIRIASHQQKRKLYKKS